MGAVPLDPTCDVCGTVKTLAPGIGFYCPNHKCGEAVEPIDDTPPKNGRYVKLSSESVQVVLQEKLREQPMLTKVEAMEIYGVTHDGIERKLTHVMVRVKHPKPDRRPAPRRTTSPSDRHPNGVQLTLASRDGVTL